MKETSKLNKKKNDRYGIHGFGITSDWSVLMAVVNTRALLTQIRYVIRRRSETFQRVTPFSNLLNKKLKYFLQVKSLREEKKDCIKTW